MVLSVIPSTQMKHFWIISICLIYPAKSKRYILSYLRFWDFIKVLYSIFFFSSIFSWYVPYMNWLFVRVWHKISLLLLLKMLSFRAPFFLSWVFGSWYHPFLFSSIFRFHFTSNSLFDFCCVILRFPLICFLLQLRCSSFHSPSLSFSLSWKKQPYIYKYSQKFHLAPHIYLFRNREKILVDLWFHIDIWLQVGSDGSKKATISIIRYVISSKYLWASDDSIFVNQSTITYYKNYTISILLDYTIFLHRNETWMKNIVYSSHISISIAILSDFCQPSIM